ncbi:hypothetical protein Psfp_02694 [Pelotomaculum sp. FP]|uniref:CC/Se motif family (seleno)protein n=1 Tax=Pelotomaculum sp. FP TaxID=261474 RepID=UPI0010651800|nr:CC/Se motif family (seleno)protein [Pelotomaculum sp. FP]TEB14731.1 hypothetical protein Psfp_02694 [Pelotomaculum sp. FP]
MIKIEFTNDAKDYIRKKNADSITVDMMSIYYGGQYNEPVVSHGKPTSPQNYDLVVVNGIKVYIFKGAETEPGGITISVGEGNQRLHVAGLVYDKLG